MQTDPTKDIGGVFSRSWQLLTANWIIIVPAIIIGIIASVLQYFFTPHITYDAITGVPVYTSMLGLGVIGAAIGSFIGLLANILTLTITTGMAAAAWKTGKTTVSDGTAALSRPNVSSAMLVLIAVSIVLSLLTIVTLGLAGIITLIVFFFLVYTMAAAVVGDFSGVDALKESFEVAKHSWVTTLIVIVLLGVVAVCVGFVALAFSAIPFLGPVISGLLLGAVVGFFSLVLVGEYISLRGHGSVPVSAP